MYLNVYSPEILWMWLSLSLIVIDSVTKEGRNKHHLLILIPYFSKH